MKNPNQTKSGCSNLMTDNEKPKYQKLKDYIVGIITDHELKSGEKLYSENELAVKFDISRHTVRQAIGELVSEGWLYREQGKGTFVRKSTDEKPNKVKTIGVITTYLNDYIFPSIIRGIESVLSSEGYGIMLGCTYNMHDKERICLENLRNQDIVGLIVEPTKSVLPNPNLDIYKELKESGVPVLFIHGYYKDFDSQYIVEDDRTAGYLATKHLIEQGHTKIGGVFKMDDVQGLNRFSGFQQAHIAANLKFSDSRINWFNTNEMDVKLEELGIKNILSECTAIVCYNDQVTIKVLNLIRENGLNVPNDISLVGFDDSQLADAFDVKLTTVAHPKELLGINAANAIIDLIEGKREYYEEMMLPELIVRGSTKKI